MVLARRALARAYLAALQRTSVFSCAWLVTLTRPESHLVFGGKFKLLMGNKRWGLAWLHHVTLTGQSHEWAYRGAHRVEQKIQGLDALRPDSLQLLHLTNGHGQLIDNGLGDHALFENIFLISRSAHVCPLTTLVNQVDEIFLVRKHC